MTRTFTLPIAAALLAGCAALPVAPAVAQADPPPSAAPAEAPSPGAIVDAAPVSDWIEIAARDLMVMELAPDAKGKPRRVVIQLMPPPFSQGWIGNMRKLAAARFWDDTSVNRVQDNYVVQWGDATEKKPLPEGLAAVPESAYTTPIDSLPDGVSGEIGDQAEARNEMTYYARKGSEDFPRVHDAYSDYSLFTMGWPVASNDDAKSVWPVHCYGMVGVGRGYSPDTGTGAELYTVIGHAPRHLDRNIALVGRVIDGMEHLSSLPRGHGTLGFYAEDESPTPIVSVRLANELPKAQQPRFAYLSTDSDAFAKYADARANRRDPFFIVPAGGADICNVPVPVKAYPWVKAGE